MGGSIALAARFNDGETICVDGWTNFMPRMIKNGTTLSGDDAIVREVLMDVARHESYAGPQRFGADGYGIVVIDFIAREIHSMQGYTSFDRPSLNQLLDINATGWKGMRYVNVLSDEGGGLLDAGRVRMTAVDGVACEPVTLTRETAIKMLDTNVFKFLSGKSPAFVDIEIDLSPFVLHEYPEDSPLTAMKARLRAVGFPMTKAEGLNTIFSKKGAGHAQR